jgi:hypothetical protein
MDEFWQVREIGGLCQATGGVPIAGHLDKLPLAAPVRQRRAPAEPRPPGATAGPSQGRPGHIEPERPCDLLASCTS